MLIPNSFYVKFIATEVPTFFVYTISVLAMVYGLDKKEFIFNSEVSSNISFCFFFYEYNWCLWFFWLHYMNGPKGPGRQQKILCLIEDAEHNL